MEKKFYTGKYDRVFKTILCDEDNKEILQEFLSRILKKKVEVVEILKNELPVVNVIERTKTVDVLVKVDEEYVHIELNSQNKDYLHTRNFIFFTSIYNKKTKKGDAYDLKTKFIHLDFTYKLDDNKDYRKYYIQDDENKRYLDIIEIIEFNMDKIMEYWYNDNEEKIDEYKHLIMLDLEKEGLEKLSEGDDFVKEYEERLNKLNEDETFQSAMTYEEDQELIRNTEKNQAYDNGKLESKIEIAKSLLENNIDINVISKSTGLSIEEINNL